LKVLWWQQRYNYGIKHGCACLMDSFVQDDCDKSTQLMVIMYLQDQHISVSVLSHYTICKLLKPKESLFSMKCDENTNTHLKHNFLLKQSVYYGNWSGNMHVFCWRMTVHVFSSEKLKNNNTINIGYLNDLSEYAIKHTKKWENCNFSQAHGGSENVGIFLIPCVIYSIFTKKKNTFLPN
jgi:hypothetical protein